MNILYCSTDVYQTAPSPDVHTPDRYGLTMVDP